MNNETAEKTIFTHSRKPQVTQSEKPKKSIFALPTFTTTTINNSFVDAQTTVLNKKNLFGDLITVNDLTILFGRSNVGKSFLGYQIAQAIATGTNVFDLLAPNLTNQSSTIESNLNNETQAQKVIYFDFEGTKEKNLIRYSPKGTQKGYEFSNNLYVSYPDLLSIYDPHLFIDAMELQTNTIGAKVVIIDNLSAISQDNEKSGNAVKLMNKIKDFQRKNNLTVILMAHTPKIYENQPIIAANLAGSANLNIPVKVGHYSGAK